MTLPPENHAPDNSGRDPAKSRFIAISAMRLTGVVMVLLGFAVVRGAVALPAWTGYLLIVLGLMEAFVVPQVLSRLWSTNDRNPPRQ